MSKSDSALKELYRKIPFKYRNIINISILHVRNGTFWSKLRTKMKKKIFTKCGVHTELSQAINAYANNSIKKLIQPEITGSVNLLSDFLSDRSDGKYNILLFPVIDWYFRVQRPQHLMRELGGKGNKVIYFTTTFNFSMNPGFVIESMPCKNVLIVKLNLNRDGVVIYNSKLSKDNISFLLHSIYLLNKCCGFRDTFSIVDLPFWSDVVLNMKSNKVIYDCMDFHAGFETNSNEMLRQEELLLEQSNLVITTAQTLSDLIADKRDNIIIRNAAEVEFFSTKETETILNKQDKVTIGYYGAVAEWFDVELFKISAKSLPEYDFILIGNVTTDLGDLSNLSNVKIIGEVPYKNLPAYLNGIDICLIPFKIIELTRCTNPVKVYEYLAAGKPVVATGMPEVELLSDYVHIGYNREEFIEKIKYAVTEIDNMKLSEFRRFWALTQDWSARATQLENELGKLNLAPLPKVSLVVLAYNNLALTKDCLYSITNNTFYKNYEVIVVDNASTDGTQGYLLTKYMNNPNFKIILNNENVGFAAGNNIGIKAADGDIIIVINNDTYVSPYWLYGLVNCLTNNPKLGLVCPVTNNIGNEAKINIHYSSFFEMENAALHYTTLHNSQIYPIESAAFFCVAIRKEVIDTVGLICEDYGLGFFEDDDYCKRVLLEGWEIAAVEDSFVHHHLSASFDKLKGDKKRKLMEKNQAIFESKWGEWKSHIYRPGVE